MLSTTMAVPASELEERRRTDEVYMRLDQHRLGSGGIADCYLGICRDGPVELRVCLKEIKPKLWERPGFQEAFMREAEISAALRHSNIVMVLKVDAERARLVLELVEGVDLRTLLEEVRGHRLPSDLVVLIAVELCKALDYAHSRTKQGRPYGIVHRDISPANVLLSFKGEVKLTDFGLAAVMVEPDEPYSSTLRGKHDYLSPEQSRQERLTGRSDLFALGIVLYQMLAGRRPFDADTAELTIRAIRAGRRTPLGDAAPEAPPLLVEIVERLLNTDPEKRFSDARACRDALKQIPTQLDEQDLGQLVRQVRTRRTLEYDVGALQRPPARGPEAWQGDSLAASVTQIVPRGRPQGRLWRVTGLVVSAAACAWLGSLLSNGVTSERRSLAVDALEAPSAAATSQVGARTPRPPPPVPAAVLPAADTAAVPSAGPTPASAEQPEGQGPSSAEERPNSQLVATAAEPAPAKLRIGTWPPAEVWIDGTNRGWAPLVVTLPPGRYRVGAGRRGRPETTKTVQLSAGRTRGILIELAE